MSPQLLVITGVSGHVGFRVLVEALSRGYKARAVIRNASQADQIKAVDCVKPYLNQVEFTVVPDLLVPGAFDNVLDGADGAVHVASPLPSASQEFKRDLIEPAVNATLGILKAAKKVSTIKRVVVTSSIASLITWDYLISSDTTKVFTVRDTYTPTNLDGPFANAMDAYGVSKAAALAATERFKQEEKPHFEVISILPSMVTGKNELGNRNYLCSSGGIEGTKWEDAKDIVRRNFPKAVAIGIFPLEGSQPSRPIRLDSSDTEEAFGWKFASFEEQVKSVAAHYLCLFVCLCIFRLGGCNEAKSPTGAKDVLS
ncbi:hypothetical protein FOC1_g10002844 [Fusarium oxysporum f. sp. cubense race 1]|uniref:NAD-dependent epimerase/dehydratase domain-containing protein n=1 Tax=Fusarium oxysporum f. sp. cubense (strain race 1) TaxID=1229664 RepID=N4UEG3_FUSC1|nr:hypothetical protein FOC1_g10002844 [Fusarium oxysporum f. sp. cubense race 1]